jgi:hypothetical protein
LVPEKKLDGMIGYLRTAEYWTLSAVTCTSRVGITAIEEWPANCKDRTLGTYP